eukprot:6917374-Heterocapsa_arctica.AAC.1
MIRLPVNRLPAEVANGGLRAEVGSSTAVAGNVGSEDAAYRSGRRVGEPWDLLRSKTVNGYNTFDVFHERNQARLKVE